MSWAAVKWQEIGRLPGWLPRDDLIDIWTMLNWLLKKNLLQLFQHQWEWEMEVLKSSLSLAQSSHSCQGIRIAGGTVASSSGIQGGGHFRDFLYLSCSHGSRCSQLCSSTCPQSHHQFIQSASHLVSWFLHLLTSHQLAVHTSAGGTPSKWKPNHLNHFSEHCRDSPFLSKVKPESTYHFFCSVSSPSTL